MLVIPLERLAFIIAKAREFDAEVPVEPDAATGSDPPDDDERQVLLDTPVNPTEEELRDAIDGLGPPEHHELLALSGSAAATMTRTAGRRRCERQQRARSR